MIKLTTTTNSHYIKIHARIPMAIYISVRASIHTRFICPQDSVLKFHTRHRNTPVYLVRNQNELIGASAVISKFTGVPAGISELVHRCHMLVWIYKQPTPLHSNNLHTNRLYQSLNDDMDQAYEMSPSNSSKVYRNKKHRVYPIVLLQISLNFQTPGIRSFFCYIYRFFCSEPKI